jgi:putative hydrolase
MSISDTGMRKSMKQKAKFRYLNNSLFMYDLHIHSKYSDGSTDIESILKKAKERNLKVIAIADHSVEHRFGLTESKAKKRQEEIERYSSKYDVEVLSAVECGILHDGEIVLPDFTFDLVLASIHTQLPAEEYYDRILKCINRYEIDVLAHLHSQLFGSVNELPERDMEIIDVLIENDVALEINSTHDAPPDDFLILCRRKKLRYSIGSDSHVLNGVGNVERAVRKAKMYLSSGKFLLDGK